MLLALLFGFLFGFVGSIPLAGPIALLVFMRGLHGAARSGLAIAVGAALAESGYAFLAYCGMGELLSRFPLLALASRGAAALILLALGAWFVVQHGGARPPDERALHVHSSFALGFGITALNPTFLATWTAAVTVLHSLAIVPPTLAAAGPFALGVAAGIVAWFALMLAAIARWRDRFAPATVRRVLQVVGAALLAMGAWAAVTFVRALAA